MQYLFLIIISIFLYFFYIYLLKVFKELINKINILDQNYTKPQAFHQQPTPRIGGAFLFFSNLVIFFSIFSIENVNSNLYLYSIPFFLLGFLDDIKFLENPKIRFFTLIIIILIFIFLEQIYVYNTGIEYLNNLMQNNIYINIIFHLLCFLTIINGCNFIDGFNGLLLIKAFIIALVLLLINDDNSLNNILLVFLVSILSIIILNFPKAKIFMGDSGAYLVGFLISFFVIETSNLNPSISPFFFCVILFYLFFEVIFSFFRKILLKKNPLLPDKNHMHMLIYRALENKFLFSKINSNFTTSVIINLTYTLIIIPPIFFMDNNLYCKFYFISCLIVYLISYGLLIKNKVN